ncbi:hypothetical protein DMUE_4962, partial [Dictyocoela muelleri]
IESLFKEITLKDAIVYLKYSWDDITEETIVNCRKKAILMLDASEVDEPVFCDEKLEIFEEVRKCMFPEDVMKKEEYLDFEVYPKDLSKGLYDILGSAKSENTQKNIKRVMKKTKNEQVDFNFDGEKE